MVVTGTAHRFFAKYIIIAQFFGAFPVCGITKLNHNKLCFKWRSFRTCHSLFMIGISLFNCCFELYYKANGPPRKSIVQITLVGRQVTCTLIYVLLFNLSIRWPRIIAQWNKIDALIFPCGSSNRFDKITNIIAFAFLISQTNTYILFTLSLLYDPIRKEFITLEEHAKRLYPHVFLHFQYSPILALAVKLLFMQLVFLVQVCETFVVAANLQLYIRFANVTKKMKRLINAQIRDESMWLKIRKDFTHLSELCATLNKALGNLTFLILVNHSSVLLYYFYIAITITKENSHFWKKLHCYYCIPSTLIQMVCVCFCAAQVEIQNIKFLNLLICLPAQLYNQEVSRLIRFFSTTKNAISAGGYFVVNRRLILGLVGAGLSYELIILQYNVD